MFRGLYVASVAALCLLAGCARLAVYETGLSYYVSQSGDDADSGGRGAPFATLERARQMVRRLNQTGILPAGGVTVYVRGGRYAVDHSFVLDGRDSGQADRPVVYRSFPGEVVCLTGGYQVPAEGLRAPHEGEGPGLSAVAAGQVLPEPLVLLDQADYVTWRGFTMEGARGAAVVVRGGRGNLIAACTVRHSGATAILVSGAGNGVVGCDVSATGAAGIRLEGGDRKTLVAAGNYADNNHVHEVARREAAAAIQLDGVGHRATHNLIHDVPQAAILYAGNDHVIEFNEIFRAGVAGVDYGAIHSGRDWGSQGNLVRCNFVHHIGAADGQAIAVYLEGCDSGDTLEMNVFCHVGRAVVIGGGRDNAVLNNVFAACGTALCVDDRGRQHLRQDGSAADGWDLRAKLEACDYLKPPWSERYPRLVGILADRPELPLHNTVSRNVCVGGQWLEATPEVAGLLELGDNLVTAVDPGFVDPRRLDLRFREDSPVWTQVPGLEAIPQRRAGLYRDGLRASWPVRYPLWRGGLEPAVPAAAAR